MTKFYKAIYRNGDTVTRSTARRTYSHAVGWSFCSRFDLAQKEAARRGGAEIAEAVEITAQEYRALKKAVRS